MSTRSTKKPVTLRSSQAAAAAEAAAMAEAADQADLPGSPGGPDEAQEALEAPAIGSAEDAEEAEAQEVPRWAAPAVPPPWTGSDKPAPAKPAGRRAAAKTPAPTPQPVAPAVAAAPPRKPFLSQSWINTLAVAAVVAAVVLGGLGLDSVLAAPSAGSVDLGAGVTMTAAPGWVKVETDMTVGVKLQKGSVVLLSAAQRSQETPSQALESEMDGLRSEASEVAFGPEQTVEIGGRETVLVVFTAILPAGTADGEIVCLAVEGRIVVVDVVAPQGNLQRAEDDIKTMIGSIEVGK